MTKNEILEILRRVGKQDLRIPEERRLAIPKNPLLKAYLQAFADCAERYRGTNIPTLPYSLFKLFQETGDRFTYEQAENGYFKRRKRFAAFGVQAWLYGRKEDIHELEDIIWAICDEYTWSLPAHVPQEAFTTLLETGAYTVDLFASETALGLAEISALMGDRLAPIVRRRIAQTLDDRIFKRVLEAEFGWMTATHNWAAVCAGAVGIAAIHAVEADEYLAEIIARLLPAIEHFLTGFAADGACMEGIGYWKYGFGFFTYFADLLERRTAGTINLFEDPRVERIAQFQQNICFPGGRTVCFSDGDNASRWEPGLSCYLSRRFEKVRLLPTALADLHFEQDHCFRWVILLRNLLWMTEEEKKDAEFHTCCLPAAQWYIGHSQTGAGVCAKAGHNGEPHNHNDVGSFQYYLNGEEMLADLGSGMYTRQYFSDARYDHFVCGSQGHGVPLIDGCTQQAGQDACAKNVQMDENGIQMEMSEAYQLDALKELKRGISFDEKTGVMTLQDDFLLDGEPHDVCERFIIRGKVNIQDGCARITMGSQTLNLHYDPELFAPVVTPETYIAHLGAETHVLTLDFHAMKRGAFTARFTMTPA